MAEFGEAVAEGTTGWPRAAVKTEDSSVPTVTLHVLEARRVQLVDGLVRTACEEEAKPA